MAPRASTAIPAAPRVAGFVYAIRNIVAEAKKVEAAGRQVRYLNIGDPITFGFRTPPHMIEAVERAMRDADGRLLRTYNRGRAKLGAYLEDHAFLLEALLTLYETTFDPRWFAAARFQPRIVAAMDRPLLEPPKWYTYAPPFLAPARIDGGVAFWRDNAAALERAQAEFGVPPEIIVAIIGVAEDGKAGIVVGVTEDLTAKVDAVALVRAGSDKLGGKGGGGRRDMAQAGGRDPARLDQALDLARRLAAEALRAHQSTP